MSEPAIEQSEAPFTPIHGSPKSPFVDIDAVADLEVSPQESDKDKRKREAEEKDEVLKEWGGKASLGKLLSLTTCKEKLVLALGFLGACAHGAGQPVLCLMWGDLIDGLGASISGDFEIENFANYTPSQIQALHDQMADQMLENVGIIAVKFIVIGCCVCVAAALQGFAFPWFVDSQLAKMRPLYFDAMLHRDVGWFDTHSPGALPGEMSSDLETFAEGFGSKLGVSAMAFAGLCVGLSVGFALSWEIALLMLVTLPLMAVGAVVMSSAVLDARREVQGPYEKAAALADEVLFAIRTVVAFGGEAYELGRYANAVDVAKRGGLKNRIKTGVGMGYIWLIYFCSMALAFWFAMTLMYNGKEDLSAGKVLSAFMCILTVGFMIGKIGPGFAGVAAAQASMARFFFLVRNESTIQKRTCDDRKPAGQIETMAFENVHFAYPARPEMKVLNGVSLTIQKGQKVAVVGESGSGKSTIMALLERFYDPLEGAVLINGEDLRTLNIESYRKQIGYVGQEPVLFATSVRENILQGCNGATEEDFEAAAHNAQLDFVKALPEQFDTYVGSGGSQFSGGQKQRIAIARALLKKPSVMFLDEATSALDSSCEKMIQQTIDQLGRSTWLGRMTIVSIAHRLSTVQNSDVIYVLEGGRVAEQGTHKDLTLQEGGIYQALAAAQGAVLARKITGELVPNSDEGEVPKIALKPSRAGHKPIEDAEDREKLREKHISKHYKVPMLRLLKLSRPYWCCFIPGLLAALVSGACFPMMGAFVLVDALSALMQGEKEEMKQQAEMAAIYFVLVGVARCVASTFQFACFGVIAEVTTREARVTMLENVFRQDIGYHDDPDNTPGKLVAALKIYTYRIARLIVSFGDNADALCSIVVGLTMAFVGCWEMAGAMLLTIPIFGVAAGIKMAVMMGAEKSENQVMKQATQLTSDSLLNARTVQASGNEQDILRLYRSMIAAVSKGFTRRHVLGGLAFGFSSSIVFFVMAGGFYFMGFLIKEGRATFESGQQAFMGILYASMGAGMASALTGDLAKAKVAAHDMFEIIDHQSLINGLEPEGQTLEKEPGLGRIEFQEVRFSYPFRPDVQVLQGVSFVLEAGQSAGLVGPSGGGKSTVMAMLQRFYDPASGQVRIGQGRTSLSELNIRWWRKQVGFVGQEPVLFNASILDNVMYGLGAEETFSPDHLEECKKMANLTFIDNHKAQGWHTQVGPRGSRLSGGQKQRVAICRALLRNPPILLLDEATSALDSQSERVVQAALEAARQGRTSIAIAHRLSTIQDCDVILVVAEGQVAETGTHGELMSKKGVYYKLQLGKKDK